MDAALYDLLVARLVEAGPRAPEAEGLVLAACEGPDALEAALAGNAPRQSAATGAAAAPAASTGVYLSSVTVEGFRGVGERATLELSPYPSLTLVVGRNGSGKSSFAEALELLLTGTNRRWENRAEVWKQGWRNLHHSPTRISADFITEGRSGKTTIARAWTPDAGLTNGTTSVGGTVDDGTLRGLRWALPLASYRPFLPHNELGSLWHERPTVFHDALAKILGLEDLTALIKCLGDARLRRDQTVRQVKGALEQLRTRLQLIEDERAAECLAATARKAWDLDRFEAALSDAHADAAGAQAELALLRELAALQSPATERVRDQARRMREAARAVVGVDVTEAGRARATAALLSRALDHVARHGDEACPVCGTEGVVGAEWQRETRAEVDRLTRSAGVADAAHAAAERERQLAAALLGAMPSAIRRAGSVAVDATEVHSAWSAWLAIDASASMEVLADHLESTVAPLANATAALRSAATTELSRREDAWRPVADAARMWLSAARAADVDMALLPALKEAETWVKAEEKRLRDERFAPIASAVQDNWTTLRQDSSVVLGGLRLEGARGSPTRRVALDVSIDGAPGQALGVMSQGELNALALSMFLPRASLPESPFRFVVIDDPVQAMDPNRIDGLARVLERAAQTHEVVVFTHDERLPAAVRRLGIDANVVEVVRHQSSAVELRENLDPVRRHIDDAFAVANADELPVNARRIVPMFCRLALEAACIEVVTRRRLTKGQRLADIEDELGRSQKLTVYIALALFDDAMRGADVTNGLLDRWGQWAQSAYSRCNKGAHGADEGDLVVLCKNAERLAQAIEKLT